MTVVKPFKGVLYNPSKVKGLERVVAPPYDIITPEMQSCLYKSHPYNIIRLILGKELKSDGPGNNRYTRAGRLFEKWIEKDILNEDEKEAFYVYNQEYREDGARKKRVGFVGLMKLESLAKGIVRPHERTFRKPKEDRLKLMRATRANLSPIFAVYRDGNAVKRTIGAFCEKKKMDIDITIDGVRHRLWRLTDDRAIEVIKRAMSRKQIFIADGHHRYKVALDYRRQTRKGRGKGLRPQDYIMTYFTDMADEGLTILSCHRLLKDLGGKDEGSILRLLERSFLVKRLGKRTVIRDWLKRGKKLCHTFGFYIDGKFFSLKLKSRASLRQIGASSRSSAWKALDVSVLHYLILKKILRIDNGESNICYARDPREVLDMVDKGVFKAAFLLNPTKISQVKSVARKRELMPHKSTYFYPKLLSGLVIYRF